MAARTLEQKLYPLANYLTEKGISSYLDNENEYILDLSNNTVVLADWSKTLIDAEKGYIKITNLPSSSNKHQLFFYIIDYYLCNNHNEQFYFLLSMIIKGFIKYYNRNDLDFPYLLSELNKLYVSDEYISEIQLVIDKKSIRKSEPKNTNSIETGNIDTETVVDIRKENNYSKYFKLCTLNIKGYKNLKDITIDFTKKKGITILIGNNGCGKSNIIEAIASIFAGLYKNRIHKPAFDYDLNYQIYSHNINIKLRSNKYTILVDDLTVSKEVFESKKSEYLPKNIVACYSGENSRLFDEYFWLYYEDYISAVKKADKMPELPLLYVNKFCWEIALLTIYFYDFNTFTELEAFCKNTIGIDDLRSITFTFDTKKTQEWKDNSVLQMVKYLNPENSEKVTLTLDEIKNKLNYMSEKEFFQTIFAAFMPKTDKVITKIDLNLILNNKSKSEIGVNSLSEGEKKYLLMRFILEVVGDENSLLLFDEPDSHIHITRKAELKELFAKFGNRENIITTHSPTLALCFDLCHLESLGKDDDGNAVSIEKKRHEIIREITGGMWNVHEQNAFLTSNKKLTLLVEGKTDKEHILNAFKYLKYDYPDLDFDVFHMNGETFIRQTLVGLANSGVEWNKKFVGIFDNDKAGMDATNGCFKKDEKNKFYRVNWDNNLSRSFFAFHLPKSNGYDGHFTIENCFESSKYEEAFYKATQDKRGYFKGLSIDKISDDLKNKSKTILADMSKDFDKIDFEGFKPLFDVINSINAL